VANKTIIEAEVVGIKALSQDLLKLADDRSGQLLPYLQAAAMSAMEPVANALRTALPHRTGALASSVRVARSRTGASIREGNEDDVLYAGPVDFGGYPGERPYLPNGRYLFPTTQSLSGRAEAIYNQAVAKALQTIKWTNQTSTPGEVRD
jgi:hypothetical protein